MSGAVFSKTYEAPPIGEKEILRYASCKEADEGLLALMRGCIREAEEGLTYKVCWRILPVRVEGSLCDFEVFQVRSKQLAGALSGCREVLLFAATVGVEQDRLIAKYGRLSPTKALLHQAIGAERIEALCDVFCKEMEAEQGEPLRPRFSPGYGDLPLAVQKDLFRVLDCTKRIGLSLNDSLLMSPSKSVTAFAGIGRKE